MTSSIPQQWIDAENNIHKLVAGLFSALVGYGISASAIGRVVPTSSQSQHEEIPSPQDTVSFMKSAVSILLQLWPEGEEVQQDRRDDDIEQQIKIQQMQRDFCIQAIQHVLFDASHELLRILWTFVAPPRNPWLSTTAVAAASSSSSSASSALYDVKAAAFRAIKSLALLCVRDDEGTLPFMFRDVARGARGIHSITRCLCSAASTAESRVAAAELLLVLTLQLHMTEIKLPFSTSMTSTFSPSSASAPSSEQDTIDINLLISTALAEPDANVRSFVLAAVQGCIVNATSLSNDCRSNDDSAATPASIISFLCTSSIVSSLLRLVAADDSRDVRCVAALATHALMSAIPLIVLTAATAASASNRRRRDARHLSESTSNSFGNASGTPPIALAPADYLAVAETSVGGLFRLLSPVSISYDSGGESRYSTEETARSDDGSSLAAAAAMEEEIVSLLQLLESVTVAAAAVGNEQVFVALRQRQVARTMILRMNQGNGKLSTSLPVLSAVVHAVRIMLELSPPFASQAPQLCDSTALTALFKLCLSLPTGQGPSSDCALELQLVLGFVFCFSAENRAVAVKELSSKTLNAFSGVLRERCAVHIAPSAVFAASSRVLANVELRDENHSLLNDDALSSLRYDANGFSIDEESARMILDGQQLRALPSSLSCLSSSSPSSSSSASAVSNNRIEVTEYWRSCNSNRLMNMLNLSAAASSSSSNKSLQQQRRAAILVGLVRFSVQSVLQAVVDVSEENFKKQHQYLLLRKTESSSSLLPGAAAGAAAARGGGILTSSIGTFGTPNAGFESSAFGSENNDPRERFVSDNSLSSLRQQRSTHPDEDEAYLQSLSGFGNKSNNNNNNNSSSREHEQQYQSLSKSRSAKRFLNGIQMQTTSSSSSRNGGASGESAEQILQQVNTSLYSEFDACIRLVLAFAEHFNEQQGGPGAGATSAAANPSRFSRDPSQPQFMMRASNGNRKNSTFGVGAGSGPNSSKNNNNNKLKNPWDAKRVQFYDTKAWTIEAVREGDLFFFAVHVASLNASVLDAIVSKARSHYAEIKKHLTVTPVTVQNRRHFLTEMVMSIMPNVIALLQKLHRIVSTQGEGHVQTALALCPALTSSQQPSSSTSSLTPTIDCGNVVPVVDFLLHYFAPKLYSMGISSSANAAGMSSGGGGSFAGSKKRAPSQDPQQQQQQQQNVDEILASLGRKSQLDSFDDF